MKYTYYSGSHVLLQQDVTVNHDSNGYHTETISGNVTSGLLNWYFSKDVEFPRTSVAAKINSFTGTSLNSSFNATYTKTSESYNYKLRISIPNLVELQKFDNYVSGTNVQLSSSAIQIAKNNATGSNVSIGGVIETYNGNNKVGESEEIIVNCKISNLMHLKINNQWKEGTCYIRVNNQWKEATPYIRINNQWKEGI